MSTNTVSRQDVTVSISASDNGVSSESATDDIAISVQHVSKMYPLYASPHDRLKQSLWYALPSFLRGTPRQFHQEFWALRDISFEVKRGETLGIIGQNGSGKSTLLQIIAGTLAPTVGELHINGRVAALLELGSGFNPEFTGRENVYLNGSILGFSREEMDDLFDEIAAFADIGDFIEQPVKLYSSGMFVRLAFAVQACVQPDILIVDEALAVGDIFFQQKCYRRLEALREQGVSVILVSHSMLDVEQFCQRGLLLDSGNMVVLGTASEAVKHYYLVEQGKRAESPTRSDRTISVPSTADNVDASNSLWPTREAFIDISKTSQVSSGGARCTGVAICDAEGNSCFVFEQGETATFFYEFEVLEDIEVPIAGLVIQNSKGIIVHGKSTLEYGSQVPVWVQSGERLRFRHDINLEIAVDEYTFEVGLATISRYNYERRSTYSHLDLTAKIIRLCHLPSTGQFSIIFRRYGEPVQLLHHGVANLSGSSQVRLVKSGG